ncbi:hypothetical protein N6H18_16885 [Reichenbachiella agarivorans]|uniref:CarboxypepD_reg-like domain-containing protein n=1 Tax=Reichenbachiella agarivorans TaxID=2979464 RepID=A0ABY6CPQ9_9BACT|nr:hypothetical protein [Reichenbachiella agarivorans]UXP32020.1 hypothetical protein N6H18_16885 [Reichenbachiella agarivorans]
MKTNQISLLILLIVHTWSAAAQSSLTSFRIIDAQLEAISYAHISHDGQLDAISNYKGQFHLVVTAGVTYQITCVGYQPYDFSADNLKLEGENVLTMRADQKVLDTVVVTPFSLEDIIKQVYAKIPEHYQNQKHVLIGDLVEYYKDTSYVTQVQTEAKIEVSKSSYEHKSSGGEVKLDTIQSQVYGSSSVKYLIGAGGHISHRFDFVMQRADFISPMTLSKYDYQYLGELEQGGRKLDVIQFNPKSEHVTGGQYRGKLYLGMLEEVFVRAEYYYSPAGFYTDFNSRWADRRMFITEYVPDAYGKWYLSYVWDEAVSFEDDFLLEQHFRTTGLIQDTLSRWTYDQQLFFRETLVQKGIAMQPGDSKSKTKMEAVVYDKASKLNWLDRIEVGYGLKYYLFNTYTLSSVGSTTYNSQNFNVTDTFDIKKGYLNLLTTIRYRLLSNCLLTFNVAGSLNEVVRNESMDLGILYLFDLKTSRPSYISTSIAYADYKNLLMYEEINQTTPIYEKKERGIQLGIGYEFRLNPNWKLALSYKNFVSLNVGESYYLQEKYGFMNLFKKKHSYPKNEISWVNDQNSIDAIPQLFKSHSFDISFIFSVK